MAKQKKIIDINDGYHLICIRNLDRKDYNPFRVYCVISPTGAPLRKRLLIKYGDFMSVIHFIRDFYMNGLDSMPVSDAIEWIKDHSI